MERYEKKFEEGFFKKKGKDKDIKDLIKNLKRLEGNYTNSAGFILLIEKDRLGIFNSVTDEYTAFTLK